MEFGNRKIQQCQQGFLGFHGFSGTSLDSKASFFSKILFQWKHVQFVTSQKKFEDKKSGTYFGKCNFILDIPSLKIIICLNVFYLVPM
jgi:hypothetical protein